MEKIWFVMRKRGWIRILEATIAVLIVSGAMIAVYSDQSVREDISFSDYAHNLQSQVLADIVLDSDLRLNVLSVEEDDSLDSNYVVLNDFVNESIPDSFGYLLRVCKFGDDLDFCKMDNETFVASMESDVFVEEVIISAEIGSGGGDEIYFPKKVKLFFWQR